MTPRGPSRSAGAGADAAGGPGGGGHCRRGANGASVNLCPLLGLGVVILGFVLRLNPVLVVAVGGLATGIAAGFSPAKVLELLGEAFVKNRFLAFFLLTLPVVGILERHGLTPFCPLGARSTAAYRV